MGAQESRVRLQDAAGASHAHPPERWIAAVRGAGVAASLDCALFEGVDLTAARHNVRAAELKAGAAVCMRRRLHLDSLPRCDACMRNMLRAEYAAFAASTHAWHVRLLAAKPATQGRSGHMRGSPAVRAAGVQLYAAAPMRLQLAVPLGRSCPSLRLRLFELHLSRADAPPAAALRGPGDGGGGGGGGADACSAAGRQACVRRRWLRAWWPYGAEEVAHAAAALLLARLALPDVVGPAVEALAAPGLRLHAALLAWNWAAATWGGQEQSDGAAGALACDGSADGEAPQGPLHRGLVRRRALQQLASAAPNMPRHTTARR
eukprot:352249-Chlamydomonas_euryale.AAC.27